MGLIGNVSTMIFALAVTLGLFSDLAMRHCRNFTVDYSTTANKTIIVTGSNSGLGYHTALALAEHGAKVILACRNSGKCEEAKKKILEHAPASHVQCMTLNLASFKSIRSFVTEFISAYGKVDVLVNNAGVMAIPQRELTEDGIEFQIGTNHFGHFLLTSLLFPNITSGGRIINHSSALHMVHAMRFPHRDIQSSEWYDPATAYSNSKFANLLFTYEINNRLAEVGNVRGIKAIAVHPGYTATNLLTERVPYVDIISSYLAMKGEDGSKSQLFAAVDPKAAPSYHNYIGPLYIAFGAPSTQYTWPSAWERERQKKLWEESVALTGEDFILPPQQQASESD